MQLKTFTEIYNNIKDKNVRVFRNRSKYGLITWHTAILALRSKKLETRNFIEKIIKDL